jgi:hypothetical protein
MSKTRRRERIQRMRVSRKRRAPSRSGRIGSARKRRAEEKQEMGGEDEGVKIVTRKTCV